MKDNNNLILSHSEKTNLLEYKNQINFFNQGEKECIELIFEDGTTLKCTPDHKIMTSKNEWIEAQNIILHETKIKKSIVYPLTNFKKYISKFNLRCGDLFLNMDNPFEVERFAKFSRLFGMLYTDGSIEKNRATIYCGDIIDAESVIKDIYDVCGVKTDYRFIDRKVEGTTYFHITLPYKFHNSYLYNLGDGYGGRMNRNSKLPSFILDKNCPSILKREFIAGMFGGDGAAPNYCKKTKTYRNISFYKSKNFEYIENLNQFLESLQKILLEDFNIRSHLNGPYEKKDAKDCYTTNLHIDVNDIIKFRDEIGFRYCTYKSFKLEVLCSYKNLNNNVFDQRERSYEIIRKLHNTMRWKDSVVEGHKIIRKTEIIYNEHYAFPNVKSVIDSNRRPRDGNKKTFWSTKFPSFEQYLTNLNVYKYFVNDNKNKDSSIYCMSRLNIDDIPYYELKIIGIRNIGIHSVYDIEVEDNHSFLANGVVVHNCQHDPKVIKYNELTKYIDREKEIIKKLREERDNKANKHIKQTFIDQLNKKVEILKPYISERSDIKKTISKTPMCEERYYRFLKEPKGVVPTILQNLLDARKNTRKQIKENQKLIEGIDNNKKIRDIDDLNKVLDKRQLAYKISANSVASTTPIPCRINGLFIYKTIEEISKGDWKRINEEQEVSTPIDNLEVWSDLGFTKPKYVMRHPKTENLFRVNTHTGSVDCTGDHSLLRNTGEEVKPKDLKIGDKLMQKDFPLSLDTPKEPLFLSLSNDTINDYILSSIEEETAFVHGVFFAEGTCGTWGVLGKAKSSWIIYNQDFRLLERCKNILNKIENQNFKISNYYESARCYHLVPTLSVIKLVNKYRDMFYDNRKYKKFPDYIFNAPFKVRQAFFMGYYNGDGNRNLKIGIVINNKGNRGSASLYYLAKSLGYKVSISYSKDKDADFTYRLQCCTDFRIKQEDSIKRIEIIYQNEENYSETIVEKTIRNEELIEFKNKKSFYRNIIINCDRFPSQKLIYSLDDAILCANDKFCYVTEYFTDGKYIVCKKYCCNKEYKTKLQTLKNKSSNMHNLCMCGKEKFKFECKNQKNIYIEKEYIEYVYDIETENHHFAAGVGNMIVHNSMYGILGVKKGLLPFMPGAMCLDGNSLISFSYGFKRKMKDLIETNYLWSYNNGQVVSNGNGLIYNGKKEIIKITLIDGRTLRCTPDHKIMTSKGWIEAGKLLVKHNWNGNTFSTNCDYSKVVVGLELPEDLIGDDEKEWKLLDYRMDTPNNREKMLAFCRILGFILADGSISSYIGKNNKKLFSSKVCIGTMLDANIFVRDIKILVGWEPKINFIERVVIKGHIFSIHIPKILLDKILLLDGILIGKRSHQAYTLPKFLFNTNCPLSIIREFLGGLFGGDGTSPSLSVSHPSFSSIQLGWTTIEKYKNDMENTMNNLIYLLSKFDIKFWLCKPRLARIRDFLVPKDIKENPRWEYIINTNLSNNLLFAEKIGFRYCTDKSNKLTIAASYQRYSDNVVKQHINLVLKTSEMYDLNNKKITIKDCLIKSREELYKNEIPLHEYVSLSKYSDVLNHRSIPHSLKNYKLLQKYFNTAREYTKLVGCEHWFLEKKGSNKVYSMDRKDISSPCLYLDVIDVRYDGVDDVYDIIDVSNHSFLANGIVVHNCTTYMGRTNIEIVADTITKKYGGKLVYGDTDSNYITFPHLKNADESWDYALKVSKEVSALFPPPIYLEFEQAIYAQFFILTKKRYMYRSCGRDGIVDKKIGKKGVLLARRDNALIIRLIYEKLISMIFDKIPRDDILYYILEELNRMCSNSVPHEEYVITKSVGDINNMNISEPYKDEKGKWKVKIGNYIAPLLPKNTKEKEKEFLKKEAIDELDYYKKCLPAVVQLAEKMRNRGQRVDVGTRLEYIIVDVGKNKKQYEKIENIDYFLQHNDIIHIDFLDYIRLMINPIDDLLNVGFNKNIQGGYRFKKDFILEQYKFRSINRKKMIDELKSLFSPKLVFKN